MNARSTGVTLLAWLLILSGAWGVLYLGFIGAASVVSPTFLERGWPVIMVLIAMLIGSILSIVVGLNLLRLRSWARLAVLAMNVLSMSVGMIAVTFSGDAFAQRWPIALLSLAWSALIVWYFLRPSVRARFQAARSQT